MTVRAELHSVLLS